MSETILALIAIMVSIVLPLNLFFMKQISEIKKTLADLCERISKEETKSDIYHGPRHDLEDK